MVSDFRFSREEEPFQVSWAPAPQGYCQVAVGPLPAAWKAVSPRDRVQTPWLGGLIPGSLQPRPPRQPSSHTPPLPLRTVQGRRRGKP